MGGTLRAIESGYIQREIQESAFAYQRQIEEKKRIIVGLNEFTGADDRLSFKLHAAPKRLEKEQAERLRRLRAKRPKRKVEAALRGLRTAIDEGANLMPPIIAAVKSLATLGEITRVLKDAFGEYRERISI